MKNIMLKLRAMAKVAASFLYNFAVGFVIGSISALITAPLMFIFDPLIVLTISLFFMFGFWDELEALSISMVNSLAAPFTATKKLFNHVDNVVAIRA